MSGYARDGWEVLLNKLPQLGIKEILDNQKVFLPQQNNCGEIRSSIEISKRLNKALHIIVEKLGYEIINPKLMTLRLLENPFWLQPDPSNAIELFLALAQTCVYTGFVELPVQMVNGFLVEYFEDRLTTAIFQKFRQPLLEPLLNQILCNAWTLDSNKKVCYDINPLIAGLPEPPPEYGALPLKQTKPLKRYGNISLPCCHHGLLAGNQPTVLDCMLRKTKPCQFKIALEPEPGF